jgi:hypothetical protein
MLLAEKVQKFDRILKHGAKIETREIGENG